MAEPVLVLAPPAVSADTVKAIEALLAQARRPGGLVGLAWVAIYQSGDFEVDVAGEAHHSPVYTRGLLKVLDDELAKLIGSR